jgi:hypothetical protein
MWTVNIMHTCTHELLQTDRLAVFIAPVIKANATVYDLKAMSRCVQIQHTARQEQQLHLCASNRVSYSVVEMFTKCLMGLELT